MASSLINKMENYEFVFVMHLMMYLFGITNELSLALQQKDQNIVLAINLIGTMKVRLQEFRDNGWESLLEETNTFCEKVNIPILNMEEEVLIRGRSRRSRNTTTNLIHFRGGIFCEVVDKMIVEMNNRFSEASTELLTCIACLDPRNSFYQFDIDKLIHMAEMYAEDFSSTDRFMLKQQLETYIHAVKSQSQFHAIEDLGSLAKQMVESGMNLVFSLVYRLIELALVLPVATASVERVFSGMKIIKTDLRSRMGDEWMNDSLVIYMEKEIFSKIENEAILQRFQCMQTRRTQLSKLAS
ncbi:unnamed protein product, partial [Cuscuta europaea]